MQFGPAILISLFILVAFDVFHSWLAVLRLRKTWVLIALGGLTIGSFFNIYIQNTAFSIGGVVVPCLLAAAIFVKARLRVKGWILFSLLFTGIGGYLLYRYLPASIWGGIESMHLVGVLSGLLAVVLGKYRSGILVCGLLGVQLASGFMALEEIVRGGYAMVNAGMGAEFDGMVISCLVAVGGYYLLARSSRRKTTGKMELGKLKSRPN